MQARSLIADAKIFKSDNPVIGKGFFNRVSDCNTQRQTHQTLISQFNYINKRSIACQTRRHDDAAISTKEKRKDDDDDEIEVRERSRESDDRDEAIKRVRK